MLPSAFGSCVYCSKLQESAQCLHQIRLSSSLQHSHQEQQIVYVFTLQGDVGMIAASLADKVNSTVHDAVEKAATALGDPCEYVCVRVCACKMG